MSPLSHTVPVPDRCLEKLAAAWPLIAPATITPGARSCRKAVLAPGNLHPVAATVARPLPPINGTEPKTRANFVVESLPLLKQSPAVATVDSDGKTCA
jgi:hypothetical protein